MESIFRLRKRGVLDGFWRGVVVDNNDPLRLGRVKVRVYPIFEGVLDEDLPWAEPAFSLSGMFFIPQVNSWVWCFFEQGDYHRPVYFAYSLPFSEEGAKYSKGSQFSEFGKGFGIVGEIFDEVGAEYPNAVVLRTPSGSWMKFRADGTVEIRSVNGSVVRINADGTMLIDALGRRIDINP